MKKLYYYRNQRYKSLKSECQNQEGRLFVDKAFPPETKSLYFSRACPPEAVEWKRPKDICAPLEPKLMVEGASSHDVTQGNVGNCWFVAACSSLALEKGLLEKVIPDLKNQEWNPQDPENYRGIFRFRFYRQGKWTEVVIDDLLPTVNNKLIYVHSTEKNEFWSALVEKAYAKLAGSYEALEAGNTADALVDFTGGVSESVDMVAEGQRDDPDKRMLLFKVLEKARKQDSLISASIRIKNRDEMEKRTDMGLVMGHAYGVTAVKKISVGEGFLSLFNKHYLYMIRLRNPWGQKEWKGAWSDGSEEWKKLKASDREKLGIVFEDDGEFWMSFDDFVLQFTNCTLCHVINTSFFSLRDRWYVFKQAGDWHPGVSAGGCSNNRDTFLRNPQFAFSIKDTDDGETMIALMQEDTRKAKEEGKKNLTIGFLVMKVEENRRYRLHQMYEKAGDSVFINSREVFSRLQLSQGRYVVVPSTYEPELKGHFLVRIFTRKRSNAMMLDKDHSTGSKIWCCFPRCRAPECVLKVVVTSVSGLEKTSRISLTPDPYVIIICEGRKVRLPVRKDTKNPQFNAGALYYVRQPQNARIVVQVWDYNWIWDSFMGQVKIPVDVNNRSVETTKQLMGRRRQHEAKMPGLVTVQITCFSDLMSV